jgi:hypothetical protein
MEEVEDHNSFVGVVGVVNVVVKTLSDVIVIKLCLSVTELS